MPLRHRFLQRVPVPVSHLIPAKERAIQVYLFQREVNKPFFFVLSVINFLNIQVIGVRNSLFFCFFFSSAERHATRNRTNTYLFSNTSIVNCSISFLLFSRLFISSRIVLQRQTTHSWESPKNFKLLKNWSLENREVLFHCHFSYFNRTLLGCRILTRLC